MEKEIAALFLCVNDRFAHHSCNHKHLYVIHTWNYLKTGGCTAPSPPRQHLHLIVQVILKLITGFPPPVHNQADGLVDGEQMTCTAYGVNQTSSTHIDYWEEMHWLEEMCYDMYVWKKHMHML